MIFRFAFCAATLALCFPVPTVAQSEAPYDFQERTRALAFDPGRFFDGRYFRPAMAIRYLGDDYGFPVYALAVRRGCTDADQGEARQTCGSRLTARMVRSPYQGEPPRPRARGQRLFAAIEPSQPGSDEELAALLDKQDLEWLEADIRHCPTALAHLATGKDLRFAPMGDLTDPSDGIVLHADTISLEIGDYFLQSSYVGWLAPGSPGAWANEFASSLEPCWEPSTAPVPWRVRDNHAVPGR